MSARRSTQWISIEPKLSTRREDEIALSGMPIITLPMPLDLSPSERWHLHFFRQCTARHCGAYFHDEFWHEMIHQMSEEQPAIRHAVIALSARHIQFERHQTRQRTQSPQELLSLQQCNKAIRNLREFLSTEPPGIVRNQVVLTTCIVLVQLALFEEDFNVADHHLQSGYRLLQEWQNYGFNGSSSGITFSRTFAQLQNHRSICTDPKEFLEDDFSTYTFLIPQNPKIIKTGVDPLIINHFFIVLGWTLGSTMSSLRSGEAAVLSMLRLWRAQLKTTVMAHGGSVSPLDCDTLSALNLWNEVLYIKFSAFCQSKSDGVSEMSYDKFLLRFQRAVVLARFIISSPKDQSILSTFPAKLVVVPPLLYCGFKCRDWVIRHQVMLLLRDHRNCEDHWISASINALEHVIETESRRINEGDSISAHARVGSV